MGYVNVAIRITFIFSQVAHLSQAELDVGFRTHCGCYRVTPVLTTVLCCLNVQEDVNFPLTIVELVRWRSW